MIKLVKCLGYERNKGKNFTVSELVKVIRYHVGKFSKSYNPRGNRSFDDEKKVSSKRYHDSLESDWSPFVGFGVFEQRIVPTKSSA